jgi:hypothetical protein
MIQSSSPSMVIIIVILAFTVLIFAGLAIIAVEVSEKVPAE